MIIVYCAWVEAIQPWTERVTVSGGRCGIAGKFAKRWPCTPAGLRSVVVDAEVLLECLHTSFTESVRLTVEGTEEV